ncbi:hypothetical protein [Hallella multisaccharivorax]|uniref:hypothetical protein n=1 Tax=Hallella multisaccharivorax TaxID=310514 RepID=UPI003613893A
MRHLLSLVAMPFLLCGKDFAKDFTLASPDGNLLMTISLGGENLTAPSNGKKTLHLASGGGAALIN